MTTHVVLFSGGLDSTILLHEVESTRVRFGDDVKAVYFDLNLPYSRAERDRLDESVLIDRRLEWLGELEESSPIHIVSLRNLYMAFAAATIGSKIYLATLHPVSESTSDGDQIFASLSSLLLQKIASDPRHGLAYPEVFVPLAKYSKARNVRRYLAAGGNPQVLLDTFSCYRPVGDVPCGECNACIVRYVALQLNDLGPGTSYIVQPESTELYKYEFKRLSHEIQL